MRVDANAIGQILCVYSRTVLPLVRLPKKAVTKSKYTQHTQTRTKTHKHMHTYTYMYACSISLLLQHMLTASFVVSCNRHWFNRVPCGTLSTHDPSHTRQSTFTVTITHNQCPHRKTTVRFWQDPGTCGVYMYICIYIDIYIIGI